VDTIGLMPAPENIGARIAMRRQVLGWTQSELAARLGVHKDTVVSWETGKHYPKRKLGLLEAVLGIDLLAEQAPPFATPDEAAIWSLERFTEDERRALIRALRQARGQ
jgi:transcriptional regulator with XRE-family HTH domain